MTQTPKTISTRQLAILAFIVSLGSKVFSLPVLLLKSGGRSAWLPLVLFLAVDILILGVFIITSRLNPNKTAFETVQNAVGSIVAKIVFLFVFVGLAIRALMLMLNITSFFSADIFDGVPHAILLLPIALLLIPFCAKSLRTLGRTGEILIFFIVPALIGLIVFIAKSSNPINLLPLNADFDSLARTLLNTVFFFGDIAAIFIAIGKIDPLRKTKAASTPPKQTKGFHPLAIFSGVVASGILVFYCVMLFSSYIDTRAFLPPNSVAFATHTAVSRFSLGRFDKILFVILTASSLLTLGVVGHAATRCVKFVLPKIKTIFIGLAFCVALYLTAVFINTNAFTDFIKSAGVYLAAFMSGFFVLFLLLSAIIVHFKNKKANNLKETRE